MKKRILPILLIIYLTVNGAYAQSYHYNQSKIFKESGYTYKCITEPAWKEVTLFNADDKYTFTDLLYKDGTEVTDFQMLQGKIPLIEDDNWTKQACANIVTSAFTKEERQRLKDNRLYVSMIIDAATGKITEVFFSFLMDNPLATIAVATYRKIELELKSKVWFSITLVR